MERGTERMEGMFEPIDMTSWNRREHFAFFQGRRNPLVCVTAPVDAGGIVAFRKDRGAARPKFTDCLYYAVMTAVNAIPEFRMRLVGRQPVIFGKIDAAFTHTPKGRELHANVVAPYDADFKTFEVNMRAGREASDARPTLAPDGGDSQGLVYLSSTPGIAFTAASNPWGDPWEDSVPRVLAGKIDPETNKIPISVEALHSFIDGRHLEAFFQGVEAVCGERFGEG